MSSPVRFFALHRIKPHAPPLVRAPSIPLSFILANVLPRRILNALATALYGSMRTTPSIHRLRLGLVGSLIPFAPLAFVSQCQYRPSRVLSLLAFFPISIHLTVPPEIPSAPTVLQLGSFHRLSRVEPWEFDGGLEKPPTDALRPIIPDNACILCFYRGCWHRVSRCLFLGYRHCFVSKKRSLRPESGPCLSPSVADHPLGPATDHRLGKLLPHQLANQTRAPPRADSSFCSSAYGVLATVSSCCPPPKGRFLRVTHPSATGNTTSRSDLHVLSMPPAFILSQDRTLHEIPSCITYSFLLRRQS
ncbi:hypothetical protein LUZ61_022632 [Rhynchospora tenuis]|uniref:Uncharacterized protein n=1 Tax=Rhynchospora tenuis TaxID=198213 RepID=A0AAD5W4Q6_9POAL|nr:hypothetical protein LUZ61_022632 [Rhynchospora tenuis]